MKTLSERIRRFMKTRYFAAKNKEKAFEVVAHAEAARVDPFNALLAFRFPDGSRIFGGSDVAYGTEGLCMSDAVVRSLQDHHAAGRIPEYSHMGRPLKNYSTPKPKPAPLKGLPTAKERREAKYTAIREDMRQREERIAILGSAMYLGNRTRPHPRGSEAAKDLAWRIAVAHFRGEPTAELEREWG